MQMESDHVKLLEDGTITDGIICAPPTQSKTQPCKACQEIYRQELDNWIKENGGMTGLEWRAQICNAEAQARSPLPASKVGTITASELCELFWRQGGMCGIEGICKNLVGSKWEIDHMTPIRRKGLNKLNNLQLMCRDCNQEKGNRTQYEWVNELPPRYNEYNTCPECSRRKRAVYRLCYDCANKYK